MESEPPDQELSLVERLRRSSNWQPTITGRALMLEAADKIENLERTIDERSTDGS